MKSYTVTDSTLRQIARGEEVFPITDGVVNLPDDIASDLLASGQIAKPEKADAKPAPKAKGKKADATDKAD